MWRQVIILILFIINTSNAYAELRDPTRPPDFISKKLGKGVATWALTSILISKDRRIAVVNGQVVHEGDEIASETVISIQPNTVQLTGPGGKITLFLLDKTVKRESE